MSDDEDLEARHEIKTEYARLGTAVGNKDLDAIRSVHAPGYTELQVSGEERDLEAVMAEWHDNLGDMIEPSLQVAIDAVDVDGKEANVIARSTQTFVSSPFPSFRFGVRVETTGRDCWFNGGGGGWRLLRSERHLTRSWTSDKLVEERELEPQLTTEERASIVRDLGAHVLPFKTVLAGNGFDDLAALDGLIGNARIVALGEASHGTAEFFQMKHRLLEYLVERKGFTVLAMESPWPEGQATDRFIKSEGDSRAAAFEGTYFAIWKTDEVATMLDWMRAYNVKRGDHRALSFAGFDMQFTKVAVQRVLDYFGRLGGAARDQVQLLYRGTDKIDAAFETAIATEEKTRIRNNAASALDLFDVRRDALLRVSTSEEYRDAQQAARIVLQACDMHLGIGWAVRDRAMADNVQWLLEQRFPGEKIVLWAHNGHVGTAPVAGEKSQGMHLREKYGSQMVVVGLASYQGEVRARRIVDGKFQPGSPAALPLAPARKISVEALFHDAGLPRFIVDLRRIPKDGAFGRWLAKPRLHRSIGSGYNPDRDSNSYVQVGLPETYDAMIFVAESTAAKSLN